jgi:tRNA dimethylallyltransferase
MKTNFPPRIAVLCGPTGVGKTSVAIEIASVLNAEIIGADSMQVYRYMDIGTAKPSALEQARIPHYMIDIVNPDDPFDAQRYANMSQNIILHLAEQGIPVLVVGGTGFYIRALIHGLFESGSSNLEIRNWLTEEAHNKGTAELYNRLRECDPIAASRIHVNDTYRIVRALEIYETTGQPISSCHQEHQMAPPLFDVIKIGLSRQREVLYERINYRVDLMVEEGLCSEVRSLLKRGYTSVLKPLQSIGYRHILDFFEGRLNWDDTLKTLKQDTRRYAKRQLTWFNSDSQVKWIDADHLDEILDNVKAFLSS